MIRGVLTILILLVAATQAKFVLLDKWRTAYRPLYWNGTTLSFQNLATNQRNYQIAVHTVVNHSFSSQGWDYVYFYPLEVSGVDSYYATGFAEGYLTRQNITDHLQLLPDMSPRTRTWIDEVIMALKASWNDSNNTNALMAPFSAMQHSIYRQLEGIVDGYNQQIAETQSDIQELNLRTLFLLNMMDEIQDVQFATGERTERSDRPEATMLIQATPYDIFAGHNTIGRYNTMRRQYKSYCMTNTLSFSGYPGRVSSGDDWILTSRELVIQSAPLYVFNISAYQEATTESSPKFMRLMAASYLSKDGSHFCKLMALNNSGTGSAQYHVLAMSQFRAGNLKSSLLHHLEQAPGLTVWADVTEEFRKQGELWLSTDLPYFSNFSFLGYTEEQRKNGGMGIWSNQSQPRNLDARAYLSSRSAADMDMQFIATVLRTNNFSSPGHQLIPNCDAATGGKCHPSKSAMFPPAARGDLNPEGDEKNYGAAWKWVGHRNSGAIDTKIVSRNSLRSGLDGLIMEGTVACGPTAVVDGVAVPFRWLNTSLQKPSDLPQIYNFGFNTYSVPYPPHGYYDGYPDISRVITPIVLFTVLATGVATVLVRKKLAVNDSSDPYSESAALLKYRQN